MCWYWRREEKTYNRGMQRKNEKVMVWISRLLIAAVTLMNVQAAFLFMLRPGDFTYGFELSGAAGEAMLQGMGLLFLMWNIPYIFAAVHPVRHFVSLVEAVIMQFIGVTGETLILLGLPGEHPLIEASVGRFILFDGAGFAVLIAALLLALLARRSSRRGVQT
jgi:hypothetical protein